MMDFLNEELLKHPSPQLRVQFLTSRGSGTVWLAPLFTVALIIRLTLLRMTGQKLVLHLNVASKGSTYRKAAISFAARLLYVPYIVHLHGGGYPDFIARAGFLTRWVVRNLFGRAACVLVLGTKWKEFVNDAGLAAAARTVVLPNAVPGPAQSVSARRSDKVQVAFLGRLGPLKGTPELVQALALLKHRSDWHAVLAGDGDVEETLEHVKREKLAGRVDVPGWLSAAEADCLLQRSSILALPSLVENLPLSVIEGMAWGLAVVVTPVGSIAEIITHGETGMLVPVGDVNALASTLEALISDDANRDRLGTNASAYHRTQLSIDVYAHRLAQIWTMAAFGADAD